jgi:hypothetical protein
MRNSNPETAVKAPQKTTPNIDPQNSNPLILQMLSMIEDLQLTQKQLRYFVKEVKLWSSPQRKL